jgi:transcription initiation factor TFIIH subunit 3
LQVKKAQPVGSNLIARILVVTGSEDSAHQYMTYMNVFFTAQKERVVLDICALDNTLVLLQQGCDITGGHVSTS